MRLESQLLFPRCEQSAFEVHFLHYPPSHLEAYILRQSWLSIHEIHWQSLMKQRKGKIKRVLGKKD